MAVGDIVQVGPTSVANGAFLDLDPASAAVEWIIFNVYVPLDKAVEFYYYDGTNSILFDSDTTDGSRYNLVWRCSDTKFVRIKNVSGGAIFISADGSVTK
jgi:hypothetical protein